MQQLKLFSLLLLSACFFSACSGNADGKNNPGLPDAPKASDSPASSSASGNAVFSYNLNGTGISGGEVDHQTYNIVWINKNNDGEKFTFFLNDKLLENNSTYAHSLKFTIPGKTGTVSLIPNDNNKVIELFLANGDGSKTDYYTNENFTVTVNNASATRVSGTFSGKMKLVAGQPGSISEFTITDGKFDLPVRNVAN